MSTYILYMCMMTLRNATRLNGMWFAYVIHLKTSFVMFVWWLQKCKINLYFQFSHMKKICTIKWHTLHILHIYKSRHFHSYTSAWDLQNLIKSVELRVARGMCSYAFFKSLLYEVEFAFDMHKHTIRVKMLSSLQQFIFLL